MKKRIVLLLCILLTNVLAAQVLGCTDPLSKNYNPLATVNDGSCDYKQVSVAVVKSVSIPDAVKETSGLVMHNGNLLTHNDDKDINLYEIDTSGTLLRSYEITGVINRDWEELAQDRAYFYIGDFGNNVKGNRKDLKILRVDKALLVSGTAKVDEISFSYTNQTDFNPKHSNSTDFDCEAMVVSKDSIYLFTKQWSAKETSVYALPKAPGTYTARLKSTYNVNGLITGAAYLEDKKLIVLSGYSGMVSPFLYLLYDYNGNDFFSGSKRKVNLTGLSFNQVEGIATDDGLTCYISNENLAQKPFLNVPQKLHRVDLHRFLAHYLENLPLREVQAEVQHLIRIYPDISGNAVCIEADASLEGAQITISDAADNEVLKTAVKKGKNSIKTGNLRVGNYTIRLDGFLKYSYKFIKQ